MMASEDPADRHDHDFARFYDLEYEGYKEDIDFYVQYALALDPDRRLPILELGCGTGRILLALAAQGFRVTGLDRSPGMLSVCARHAQEQGLRERITLLHGDLRSGPLTGGPYNMAFYALNTFAHLTSTEDQLAALGLARKELVQHGITIIDLTPPLPHLLPPSHNEVLHHGSYRDIESDAIVHKFVTGYARPAQQLHHVRLMYDVEEPDGTLRRFSREEVFRWTGRYEMELLLRTAGFKLEHLYGSYDLDDCTDDSERMIFVARA